MKRLEQVLHASVAQYLSSILLPPAIYTTVPIGGGGAIRGAILRGLGTMKGWPDIQIVHDGHLFLVELKSAKGRLSPNQKLVHAALIAAGCKVAVVRSLDELDAVLRDWGVPLRGHVIGNRLGARTLIQDISA